MTLDEVRAALAEAGEKPYRADQLADWVYSKAVTDPARMSNVPDGAAGMFAFLTSTVANRAESTDGTVKLLLDLHDGEQAETVLIPSPRRATACLSAQVGCAMGCAFCASGLDGLRRNLSAGEIVEQILHLRQATDRKVTNVVFMGMGEPLANYEATVAAVRAVVDPKRFGISARRVTISTIGLPKQIRRLAREDLAVTLAISLHAPTDALRKQIVPHAARHSIGQILAAAAEFFQARKREVTLEYILLGGVNDHLTQADALARLAKRLRCNVNLISYNPVESLPFAPSAKSDADAFVKRLREKHVSATLRRSRGADIAAACGQLRRRADGNGASPAKRE